LPKRSWGFWRRRNDIGRRFYASLTQSRIALAYRGRGPLGDGSGPASVITISTDNPTILGCSLTDELRLLVEHFGFSLPDLAQLQINAFEAALLPADQRAELLAEVEGVLGAQL
jgi:hypothetical protein